MKNKLYALLLLICILGTSCEDYNERLVPLVGVYEGFVVGLSGPITFNISLDTGDDVLIDAPFNGFGFALVLADVDEQEAEIMELDFCDQALDNNIFICGSGIFSFGDIQLDYEIDNGAFVERFTLVASKL